MPKPKSDLPKLPLQPHLFIPVIDLPPDWKERRYCGRDGCGLPEDHRVHAEYVPPEDDSDRITGDRELER